MGPPRFDAFQGELTDLRGLQRRPAGARPAAWQKPQSQRLMTVAAGDHSAVTDELRLRMSICTLARLASGRRRGLRATISEPEPDRRLRPLSVGTPRRPKGADHRRGASQPGASLRRDGVGVKRSGISDGRCGLPVFANDEFPPRSGPSSGLVRAADCRTRAVVRFRRPVRECEIAPATMRLRRRTPDGGFDVRPVADVADDLLDDVLERDEFPPCSPSPSAHDRDA